MTAMCAGLRAIITPEPVLSTQISATAGISGMGIVSYLYCAGADKLPCIGLSAQGRGDGRKPAGESVCLKPL
jgi:hypothetical protein